MWKRGMFRCAPGVQRLSEPDQRQKLGPERFLVAYANGLDELGYENSPLEKMAYDAETSFKRSSVIFDAEKFVAEHLARLR